MSGVINLSKGGKLNLDKSLSKVRVGLAWDASRLAGQAFDADVSAAVLKVRDGQPDKRSFVSTDLFIYYNNKGAPNGCIRHSGDNRTGAGDGDDESIVVDINALPPETAEVTFIASIHEGDAKRQDWSMLHAVATLYNEENGAVLARFDLGTDFAGKISTQTVSLHRNPNGSWVFTAIGQGHTFGLGPFVDEWSA